MKIKRTYLVACLTSVLSACAAEDDVPTDDSQDISADGESAKPVVESVREHGAIEKAALTTHTFTCAVTGNNAGCAGDVYCPAGNVKSVKAGCNLESGDVSWSSVSSLPSNFLFVFRRSDDVSQGGCRVDSTVINQNSADIPVSGFSRKIFVACKEHDENGGDCVIRGYFTCG